VEPPGGPRVRRESVAKLTARDAKGPVPTCVKRDRLARSTHHHVSLGKELEALSVDPVVLDRAIDTTTPSGPDQYDTSEVCRDFGPGWFRSCLGAGRRKVA